MYCRTRYPWCKDDAEDLEEPVRGVREPQGSGRVLDYDDLLLFWRGMPRRPRARRGRARSLSTPSWWTSTRTPTRCKPTSCALLRNTTPASRAVGDDAQAIYGFRASDRAQHPGFPHAIPRRDRAHPRAELPQRQPILSATDASSPRRPSARSRRCGRSARAARDRRS